MRGTCPAVVDFHGCPLYCSKWRDHGGGLHVMKVRNGPLGWMLAFWYDEPAPAGPWTGGVVPA